MGFTDMAKRLLSALVVVAVAAVFLTVLMQRISNNNVATVATAHASQSPTFVALPTPGSSVPVDSPSVAPATSSSPKVTAEPVTSDMPTIVPSMPVATASPSEELAKSDAFWNPISAQPPSIFRDWEYESLADIARHSDLVVVGRLVDVYVGEVWKGAADDPGSPLVYGRVEIDEVVKGEPVSRAEGSVEMQLELVGDDWQPPDQSAIPSGEAIFFLLYDPRVSKSEGRPPRSTEIAPYSYFRQAPESVVRSIGGNVSLIEPGNMAEAYGQDYYPLQYEDENFDQFLDEVRAAAAVR